MFYKKPRLWLEQKPDLEIRSPRLGISAMMLRLGAFFSIPLVGVTPSLPMRLEKLKGGKMKIVNLPGFFDFFAFLTVVSLSAFWG